MDSFRSSATSSDEKHCERDFHKNQPHQQIPSKCCIVRTIADFDWLCPNAANCTRTLNLLDIITLCRSLINISASNMDCGQNRHSHMHTAAPTLHWSTSASQSSYYGELSMVKSKCQNTYKWCILSRDRLQQANSHTTHLYTQISFVAFFLLYDWMVFLFALHSACINGNLARRVQVSSTKLLCVCVYELRRVLVRPLMVTRDRKMANTLNHTQNEMNAQSNTVLKMSKLFR